MTEDKQSGSRKVWENTTTSRKGTKNRHSIVSTL